MFLHRDKEKLVFFIPLFQRKSTVFYPLIISSRDGQTDLFPNDQNDRLIWFKNLFILIL